jgi:hypothetical protein
MTVLPNGELNRPAHSGGGSLAELASLMLLNAPAG